ncbi:hypothetical protein SAMN05444007_102103 [Cribrihabitans marinus]|uniref:Sulfotransferase family protein n=1 Tax=Cribrihabitans marinus TaxID=1227549 RepID=A0A1H6SH99_9RHOB|nr:hypothetical protein [Cribrihabitans marinus]GGH23374.1 gamma-glutamyl kinase [Cribrihabitans marinus]SEI67253.1 hypothetical protein SAMN05444007_102103 [Cribrihabitans marinus]
MQIYLRQNLVFLAVPKTGTTAVEMALRKHADIVFAKSRKHLTAGQYHRKVAPMLEDLWQARPERMAVMREPVEQIRSWFRYRARQAKRSGPLSTEGLSFDDFVRDVIRPDPPPHAAIGSQLRFLSLADGSVPVDHLFAYEAQPRILAFLRARFGADLDIAPRNVSPQVHAPLSPEVEQALRAARADEFALHERLRAAGGYLQPSSG